jgi:hypothetical protein
MAEASMIVVEACILDYALEEEQLPLVRLEDSK